MIQTFTDLVVWQEAHKLVLLTYKTSKSFLEDERFSLTNQIRRSAVSITSNIAEGFARNSAKDKLQFYAISKGSLLELSNQALIARDLEYISRADFTAIDNQVVKVSKLISGLIKTAPSKTLY